MGDFLPFYEGFPVETRADYKHFQAHSNAVETMGKFLLITEILTHEYLDNGNRLMSFQLPAPTLRKRGRILLIIKTPLFQYSWGIFSHSLRAFQLKLAQIKNTSKRFLMPLKQWRNSS